MTKNPKLQLCRHHFPLEALSIHQPPNIVPPKEHSVGTAAILDFCYQFNVESSIKQFIIYYAEEKPWKSII